MENNELLVPSYQRRLSEAEKIAKEQFKEDVVAFSESIKNHLKNICGSKLKIGKPHFTEQGIRSSIKVHVIDSDRYFYIVISNDGVSLQDSDDTIHYDVPVKKEPVFFKKLKNFIASYAAAPE